MNNKSVPYLAGRFFDGISSGLFMLALPWLMLQHPNMGTFVAFVSLACTVFTFLVTPYFSALIDRMSRKRLLVAIQSFQMTVAFALAIIYMQGFESIWILALAQLVYWVSSNVAWFTNNAFTQENYEKHEYARISSYQEIILQITTLGAGALGVILLELWGVIEFSLFAAIASTIALISYVFTPYSQKITNSKRQPMVEQIREVKSVFIQNPTFFGFILLSCVAYPMLTFLGKLVPIYFSEQGISGNWVAMYNVALGLGAIVIGILIPVALARYSHHSIMRYSTLALALVLLFMGSAQQPIFIIVGTLIYGSFNALNRITRVNWMHHEIDVSQRGRIDGGLAMFSTTIQSISYVVIALLSHYDLTRMGFFIASAVLFVSAMLMSKLSHKVPNQTELVLN